MKHHSVRAARGAAGGGTGISTPRRGTGSVSVGLELPIWERQGREPRNLLLY